MPGATWITSPFWAIESARSKLWHAEPFREQLPSLPEGDRKTFADDDGLLGVHAPVALLIVAVLEVLPAASLAATPSEYVVPHVRPVN